MLTIQFSHIIARISILVLVNHVKLASRNIFTKVPVKCLFMARFSKLKVLQKAGTLLDTCKLVLESESILC